MFTRIPRRRSHLRAATRQAAARLRRFAVALPAITCALLASVSVVPAASATEDPPGGAPLTPFPAPTAQAAAGGMAGWQIALIALGAALIAAIAAVIVDRTLATRRSASSTTA
jgi:hypothetical protein